MRWTAALIVTSTILPGVAVGEPFQVSDEDIQASITTAAALYEGYETRDPYQPIELDDAPAELAALYASLDAGIPPSEILTLDGSTIDADKSATLANLPTTFAPGSAEDLIIRYIRKFESGKKGYDAVWHGNRHPLPKPPTEMTVCEVRDWQLAARHIQASTAIGLYQFVGGTFRQTLEQMDLDCDVKFDPATQDRMGLARLHTRFWAEFKAGLISVEDFGYELAGEWAAFPATKGKDKGYSRHRRIAGNRHQVELDDYLAFLNDLREKIESGELPDAEAIPQETVPENPETRLASGKTVPPVFTATHDSESNDRLHRISAGERQGNIRVVTFADGEK